MRSTAPDVLPRLTSLRAFAALFVLANHLTGEGVVGLGAAGAYGYTAVGFFFVLSGFVLVWSTPPMLPASTFWRRRFARIYPATLLTILIAITLPYQDYAVHPGSLVAGVLLVKAWYPHPSTLFSTNSVTWSLSAEAFFYLLLPGFLRWATGARLRTVAAVAGGWFVLTSLVVYVCVWKGDHHPFLKYVAYCDPAVRLGEFLLGAAVAVAARRGRSLPPAACAALILGGLLAVVCLPNGFPLPDVWLTPCWVGIIGLAVARDTSHPRGLLAHPAMVYAGEVSFCFYLIHQLVLINLKGAFDHGGVAVALATLAGAIVGAVMLHHLVEIPFQRWIRGAKAPPSIATAAPHLT